MTSSEIADAGRFSGQRSNFSNTCNRLSQYIKENRSFGDLSLSLTRNCIPSGNSRQTMDLLPMIEKSGQKPMNLFPNAEEATRISDLSGMAKGDGQKKAQMTIFYGGQVVVFNDFPADKAKEIMLLASNSMPSPFPPPRQLPSPSPVSMAVRPPCFVNQRPPQTPIVTADLPLSRRASLSRFLEKRKDRIVSLGPYPMSNLKYNGVAASSSSSKGVIESKGWLGLGPHLPVKTEQ
ncbi:unnamed protein product [Cuscuta epithymum]|uniref:Protein TIFY n=1 Tax=Cuscuta epithymum TaxID=186058 RepID=A0AAV0FQ34_9ASTE|nr:unnamed protein product [Cuscuta epithymum]